MRPLHNSLSAVCALVFALMLSACEVKKAILDSDLGFSVGGSVSGLTGTGLVLQNNGGDNLKIATNGAFTFINRLSDEAAYKVTILTQPSGQACAVVGGTGTVKSKNVTNVAVVCRVWGTAQQIENNDAGDAASPQIAFDATGNALAVWQQTDGTRTNIWSNRYTAGSGWGTAGLIEFDDNGGATLPQIAFDKNGNAIAVWQQSDGTRTNVLANRYTAGAGWGAPALLETSNAGGAESPQIAIDNAGNALAVWQQSDGARFDIFANRYAADTGWGVATLVETGDAGDATAPQIAFDTAGNALAVWQQTDGTRTNIWANRYTPAGVNWGTAGLIETGDAGNATRPQITFDASGNAVAVWEQSDGTRTNIWSNRYTAGAGWGTAVFIETDDKGSAGNPRIAADAAGNAIAVWHQFDSSSTTIWSNRYTAGAGWGTAAIIATSFSGNANAPQIAVDGAGNAIAVWYQSSDTLNNIHANRYLAGAGWGLDALIETDDKGGAFGPQIAFDAAGNAIAVWQQSDGARFNIWANRYQ